MTSSPDRLAAHPSSPVIRVVVADDQELVRTGLRLILAHQPGLAVVGEAADGVQAVEVTRRLEPDVVLMDVRMPRLDGIEATRIVLAQPRHPAVLVLTTFDLDEYVYRALHAGAQGFLLKDTPEERLIAAVRAAAAGAATFTPAVIARLVDAFGQVAAGHPRERHPALARLTSREVDVLLEVAAGHSNSEIARRLSLGENTVKSHVARILTKLNLASRTQAVALAYESGLVGRGRS